MKELKTRGVHPERGSTDCQHRRIGDDSRTQAFSSPEAGSGTIERERNGAKDAREHANNSTFAEWSGSD